MGAVRGRAARCPYNASVVRGCSSGDVVLSVLLVLANVTMFSLAFVVSGRSRDVMPLLLVTYKYTLALCKVVEVLNGDAQAICTPAKDDLGRRRLCFTPRRLGTLRSNLTIGRVPARVGRTTFRGAAMQVSMLLSRSGRFTHLRLVRCRGCVFRPMARILCCGDPRSRRVRS